MLYNLQVLRFFAALYVVMLHFRHFLGPNYSTGLFHSILSQGYFGVDVFFVLAGLIMVVSTDRHTSPGHFLARRFWRIYSAYWPIMLVMVLWFVSQGGIPERIDILGSVLLYQYKAKHLFIGPSWSLSYELMFYAIFFVTLFLPRRSLPAVYALLLIALNLYIFSGAKSIAFLVQPRIGEFFLGVMIGHLLEKHSFNKSIGWVSFGLSLVLIAVLFTVMPQGGHVKWIYSGLLASLLIFGLVVLERNGVVLKNGVLLALGNASYSIYLIHKPLKLIYNQHLGKLDALSLFAGTVWEYLFMILVALGLGLLYSKHVEIPLYQSVRRRFQNMSHKRTRFGEEEEPKKEG